MDGDVRRSVRNRAGNRCEYCRTRQKHVPFSPLQLEHVIPKKHGGNDDSENLALACDRCNLHKGPNLSGIDPVTGDLTVLFNPRTQDWDKHFARFGAAIERRTPIGRTTVNVLNMNEEPRMLLREAVLLSGESLD